MPIGDLLIAVNAGIVATITPCVLPLYPGFLAYLTSDPVAAQPGAPPAGAPAHRPPAAVAALLVWLGVVVGMVAIGAILALASVRLGQVLAVLVPAIDIVLIILGALLVAGRNPFARLPQPSATALAGFGPYAGSFGFGLLFAPIALPCSGPFLIGIFVASLTIDDAVRQLGFFAAFGVGFGLPLLLLGVVGQARGRQLAAAVVRWERPIQVVVGLALIAVGVWDLSVNLPRALAG